MTSAAPPQLRRAAPRGARPQGAGPAGGRVRAAATTRPARRGRGTTRWEVGALVAVAALTAWGLAAHVLWFDELQAWSIARASHSIGDLYGHLRLEGHPIGWYLLLFALTRLTGDPRAMQVLEWVIVVTTSGLVLLRAPFGPLVRVGLVLSYTISFEYGVISRGYGLGVLALVVTLLAVGREHPRWAVGLVAAVLLAWTSLAGALLAATLAAAVLLTGPAGEPPPARTRRRRFGVGVLVGAVGAAITCIPPSNFRPVTTGVGNLAAVASGGVDRVTSAASGTWRGLVPLPIRLGAWNTQLLDRLPAAGWVEAALSAGLVVVVFVALRGAPTARAVWALGSAASFVFFLVVALPDLSRYAALTFLVLVASVWVAVAPPGRAGGRRGVPRVFGVVVAVQVAALLALYPSTSVHAFSPDRTIAAAAHAHHLDDRLVSGEDFDGVSVGAYLDRSTYSVARHGWERFFVHDELEASRYDRVTGPEAVCAAQALAAREERPAGLITERSLAGAGRAVRRLALDQRVGLYEVAPTPRVAWCARPVR